IGSVVTSMILVGGIKLVKRQLEMERQKQKAEKAALTSELKFLKSQLNPHFMFNALNNIYFLIKKDPDTAADALAKYSDILRYQIYHCNEPFIALREEVDFLENYIRISKLSKNRLTLNTDLPQQLNGEKIAPLVLIPFVENAFKHVSDEKDRLNQIDIELRVDQAQLQLKVENTFSQKLDKEEAVLKEGGVGLHNVKRRLELLYPKQYQLQFLEQQGTYKVDLKLSLK
ncbi:MAG: histidine kinase, partial [Bacteroidota bacterium]